MDDVEIEWERGGGFLYRPSQVIARGAAAVGLVSERGGSPVEGQEGLEDEAYRDPAILMQVSEPLEVIAEARSLGRSVQPNHVFVAHCGCGDGCGGGCGDPCCGGHPSTYDLGDLESNPFRANPFRANPFRANPFRANPLCGNPFRANPFRANAPMANTARPLAGDQAQPVGLVAQQASGRGLLVLDTGLTDHPDLTAWFKPGHDETPDSEPVDGKLDSVAGHGTFIAGLISQVAPDVQVTVKRLVSPRGVVSEWDVAVALDGVAPDEFGVVNMSFGGPVWDASSFLDASVAQLRGKGVALVASAGNDATCRRYYPAAFPSVVAVGALDVDGPAPFTNFGSWVDACAHGVDLVSTFFDLAPYNDWASWSGTSFAAPVVAATIARQLASGKNVDEAIDAVIDVPERRIPCLGTIVGDVPLIPGSGGG